MVVAGSVGLGVRMDHGHILESNVEGWPSSLKRGDRLPLQEDKALNKMRN